MTTTERLLQSGLLEAVADLEFVRDRETDSTILQVVEAAIEVARLYLRAAEG